MAENALPDSGKVVAITGTRKGLGKSLALHFIERGAVVCGLSRGESTITHERYRHFQCDVRDAKAVRATFQAIGPLLHVVINNAAVLTSQHSFLLPATSAEDMLMTNVLGAFLVSREAAKVMKKTPGGRLIHISSMAASLQPAGDSIYAASKSALETLSNVLAKELSGFGITSNSVGVTAIETDMLAQLPRAAIDAIVAKLPVPRYATEADVMNVVDFFASPKSGYITAQTIYLGGLHP